MLATQSQLGMPVDGARWLVCSLRSTRACCAGKTVTIYCLCSARSLFRCDSADNNNTVLTCVCDSVSIRHYKQIPVTHRHSWVSLTSPHIRSLRLLLTVRYRARDLGSRSQHRPASPNQSVDRRHPLSRCFAVAARAAAHSTAGPRVGRGHCGGHDHGNR